MSLPVNKMTFVFLKRTRQILATATRLALPPNAIPTGSETKEQLAANSAAELKRLVGGELRVRNLPVQPLTNGAAAFDLVKSGFSFPATELDVITDDFKPTSFADPRMYFINEENVMRAGADPSVLTVTVTATKISIEVAAITHDTNVVVWVFRDDNTKPPFPLDGVIKKDVAPPLKVEIPVALTPGNYHSLILVQDFLPAIYEQNIP